LMAWCNQKESNKKRKKEEYKSTFIIYYLFNWGQKCLQAEEY
jgi:hypothetical protein